jgi:hypothetical protein
MAVIVHDIAAIDDGVFEIGDHLRESRICRDSVDTVLRLRVGAHNGTGQSQRKQG